MLIMRRYVWYLIYYGLSSLLAAVYADDGSSSWGAGVDEDGNYYNQFSVCDESTIVIQEMSLLCDSPGAYYYGSGKYRNSANCMGGDKARLEIEFDIAEELDYEQGYGTGYITVQVEAYGSIATQVLHYDEDMCNITSLKSVYGDECPSVGTYQISEIFYWPDQEDDYDSYSFTPKIVVGVASEPNKGKYDLGGANTDMCAGNTFVSWTTGVRKSAANTLRTFLITFGILAGCVIAIGIAGLYIVRKANEKPTEEVLDEDIDENEYHKIAMVGNNRNLVDF